MDLADRALFGAARFIFFLIWHCILDGEERRFPGRSPGFNMMPASTPPITGEDGASTGSSVNDPGGRGAVQHRINKTHLISRDLLSARGAVLRGNFHVPRLQRATIWVHACMPVFEQGDIPYWLPSRSEIR